MAQEEIHELLEKIAAFVKGNPEGEKKVEQLRKRLGESGGQSLQDAKHLLGELGLGNILGGMENILSVASKLQDVARDTEGVREFDLGKGRKGVVSFGGSVRTLGGLNENTSSFQATPFSKRGVNTARRPVVEEEKEPALEVFEEESSITVMGDMPGVTQESIRWNIEGTTLTVWTEEGRKYRKTLDLPSPVTPLDIKISYRNGVIVMTLKRSA